MATSLAQVCFEHDNGCDYGCPVCAWQEAIKHERREIAQMLRDSKAIENPDIMVKANVLTDIFIAWINGRDDITPVKQHHE